MGFFNIFNLSPQKFTDLIMKVNEKDNHTDIIKGNKFDKICNFGLIYGYNIMYFELNSKKLSILFKFEYNPLHFATGFIGYIIYSAYSNGNTYIKVLKEFNEFFNLKCSYNDFFINENKINGYYEIGEWGKINKGSYYNIR